MLHNYICIVDNHHPPPELFLACKLKLCTHWTMVNFSTTVELPIPGFNSVNFCFTYFDSLLLCV